MTLAPTVGLGLKAQHYADALAAPADGLWFEVHAENYMVEGGPRLAWLEAIRARHPVSLHGVALSLAADAPADDAHLARLARLVRRFEPVLVSEHLAWSGWGGAYFPDLLPVPRTGKSLERIVANVDRAQEAMGRRIAIENPSHYLRIAAHEWDEIGFMSEIARRTGCGLLLDVNNVHVSANNLGGSAEAYLDAFPGDLVTEIHLAGHKPDPNLGDALLIDSHDAPVAPAVWALFARLVGRIGARPTLIERDGDVPDFRTLLGERAIARETLGCALRVAA